MRTVHWVAVALVAAVLAALGAVPAADNVTHRVLGLVEQLPWSALWSPLWNPRPLESYSIRPLSVLLLKVYGLVVEGAIPPLWMQWVKGFASLFGLAAGGVAWLRGHRLPAWPALAVPLLTPTLFSAWYLPEFDALAAGATLGGCALMARGRWLPAGLLLAFSLLLKESSALVTFAFLFAELVGRRQKRWLVPIGLGVAVWLFFTLQLPASAPHGGASWSSRFGVLEHDLMQLVYLLSPAGALLVLLGGARQPALSWIGLAGLIAAPLLVGFSHYETMYYSPRWMAWACGAALALGLILWLRKAPTAALAVILSWAGLSAVMVVGPTAREDLASRLFLACAVPMVGLAWQSVERLWSGHHRWAVGALAAGLAWYPLAHALNYTQDFRARVSVDVAGRTLLAEQDLAGSVVLFDNHVEPLGGAELTALGATSVEGTYFSMAPAWLHEDRLPVVDWSEAIVDPEASMARGRRVYLYFLSGTLDEGGALAGDFSWTRREWGIFTPMDTRKGGVGGTRAHNLIEDQKFSQTRPRPSWMEARAVALGAPLCDYEVRVTRVPLHLHDAGRRLLEGAPLLEGVSWRSALYAL
jgi:hypothetical protein